MNQDLIKNSKMDIASLQEQYEKHIEQCQKSKEQLEQQIRLLQAEQNQQVSPGTKVMNLIHQIVKTPTADYYIFKPVPVNEVTIENLLLMCKFLFPVVRLNFYTYYCQTPDLTDFTRRFCNELTLIPHHSIYRIQITRTSLYGSRHSVTEEGGYFSTAEEAEKIKKALYLRDRDAQVTSTIVQRVLPITLNILFHWNKFISVDITPFGVIKILDKFNYDSIMHIKWEDKNKYDFIK